MITNICFKNILSKRGIQQTKLLLISINRRCQSTEASQQTVNTKTEYYDIVICGGGMVGTAMARALGKDNVFKNLKVALIESSPKKNDYVQPQIHSNRVCALNDKTIQLFKSLDCFDFIQNKRFGSVKHMHVWDGSSDSFISFNGKEDDLALIVENDLIQASLSHNLHQFENINVLYSSRVKDFNYSHQDVILKLNDGKEINTKLLIGSDGANSFIRNKSNFKVTKWDYDQVAIVATLKLAEKQVNDTFWQRFLSTGPIALYPLNEEYSNLIWTMKRSLAKEIMSMSDDKLVEEVNRSFLKEDFKNDIASVIEEKLHSFFDFIRDFKLIPQANEYISSMERGLQLPPKIESIASNSRGNYSLSFLHSNNYVKKRIALIGDAAHRLHPTSGQAVTFGFGVGVCDNLGFGDVQSLAKILRENVLNGAEVGSKHYLEKYESQRQSEVFFRAMGVDFMNRLYSDYDYPIKTPIIAARTIGLTVSHRWLPLKNFYYKHALSK